MTNEILQPAPTHSLGSLRSDIILTLHSAQAVQLWKGRAASQDGKVVRIASMPECMAQLSRIQKDAANDNPFADYYLLQFEEKVIKHREEVQKMVETLFDVFAEKLPENFDISRCVNVTPVQYQITSSSPLSYLLIYLMTDFDLLARTASTASHIALMTKAQTREWIDAGARLIRQCYGAIDHYRSFNVTRDDAKNNTPRYQEAVKRFKMTLPDEMIRGENRANFAPEIRVKAQTGTVKKEK